MATTSPDDIWSPDAPNPYQLTTDLAAMADSVQDAITAQGGRFVAAVANQAARDAIFTAPVHGNRVYRNDLGYEETYFGLYNVSTNPSGASAAGWYPSKRAFVATRTSSQTIGAAGFFIVGSAMTQTRNDGLGTYSAGAFTVTAAGWYEIIGNYYLTSESIVVALEVSKNSTAPNTGSLVSSLIRATGGGTSVSVRAQLAAGDVIRLIGYTSLANTIDTSGSRGAGLSIVKI